MEDKDIIGQIREGNYEPYYRLYTTLRADFIIWVNQKYGIGEHDARDIYQELFVAFWHNIRDKRLVLLTCDVKTYLYSIGKHLSLNFIKKQSGPVTFPGSDVINSSENPLDLQYDREYYKKIISDQLHRLPEKDRKIIEYFYVDGLDMSSIAERLGYKNADVAKKKKYEVFKKLASMVKSGIKNYILL